MAVDFPGQEDALRRTLEVADRCTVELELGRILLPQYPTPEGGTSSTTSSSSARRARAAVRQAPPELEDQLRFELKTVKGDGLRGLLPDRLGLHPLREEHGISVGPGRGSAAGSLVAYCLRITDVDPMRYDLLFERFLNPERGDLPDMDIDFSVAGRDRVINYVAERYGRDRVAQIITFGTMAARARCATRAASSDPLRHGRPAREADPEARHGRHPVGACLKPGQELKTAYDSRPARARDRRPRAALEGSSGRPRSTRPASSSAPGH